MLPTDLAKKMGQKDVDPLFKLPRLPAKAVKDLAEELSQFELPSKRHLPSGQLPKWQHPKCAIS